MVTNIKFNIKMETNTLEKFKTRFSMAKVFINHIADGLMKEDGQMGKLMDMEFTHRKMELFTKEIF